MRIVAFALTDSRVYRAAIAGTLPLGYVPDQDDHRHQSDIRSSKKELMEALEFWVDEFLAARAKVGLKQNTF
jgi:anthranilate/para-aminobenzoate synthase component I